MKRATLIFLIFLLSACASLQSTPTSTPTPSNTPTPTNTPEPTYTPVDPNKPEGATGKDSKGYYLEVEGVKYYDTKIIFGEDTYRGFLGSHVKNGSMENGEGMPLIRNGDFIPDWADTMPIRINVSSAVGDTVPFFKQNPNVTDPNLVTLTREMTTILRKYSKIHNVIQPAHAAELITRIQNHDSQNASFEFSTPDGISHTWNLWQGYQFNWVSVDEIKIFNQYWETGGLDNGLTGREYPDKHIITYWTVTTAPDGTLVVIGATNHPELLGTAAIGETLFGPMEMVIRNKSLSSDQFESWDHNGWPSDLAYALTYPDRALFTIEK